MSNVDEIRKALQDFLAPEIQEIKGELKAINVRLDGMEKIAEVRYAALDQRFDDLLEKLALSKRIESLERAREEKTN